MEWLIARVGLKAARSIVLALLIGGAFGGYVLWNNLTDWWDGRKLDKVTEQRDQARAERDVARKDADTGEKTAAASSAARKQNDEAIPRIRADSAARVDRAVTADRVQGLRDDSDALAGYETARSALRGKVAR